MKITRRQLRQIIRESESYKHMLSKNHVFGEPWSGSPHDLAVVQGRTFGGGSVVDLKGYDIMVDAGVAFTNGSAKKMLERLRLRRILQESVGIPAWPEKHFAWRAPAFTRGEELRYILDVADPETVQATIDIGEPVPPGANVMVVMGAHPNSEKMWMHDSELLDLIEREGWYERPPPKGADPAGFWDGKGEWQEPSDDDFSLPDESLPPAISESQLRKIVRDQLILEQEGGDTIGELIKKVPKKALIAVLKKGFKNPKIAMKMGKFYLDGANWDSLVNFMSEKLKDEAGKFTDEDAVLKYIDDNADKLIGFGVEHYNQEHPDDEPIVLEYLRLTKNQLRRIIREAIVDEDKSGKGACPDSGCIKKGDGGWKIISNKTGKEWPQTYKTKTSAQNALKAYHARG